MMRPDPENRPRTPRMLVADPHPVARAGVRAVAERNGLAVVGEAEDGPAALRLATELAPDLLVTEADLPGLPGPKLVVLARRAVPGLRAVVVAANGSAETVADCLAAGAAAFVHKGAAADVLERAVRAAAVGGPGQPVLVVPPEEPELAGRELEVVRLVALGHLSKEIARRLHVSVKTVEVVKSRGVAKLGVTGVVGLRRYAVARGWHLSHQDTTVIGASVERRPVGSDSQE